MKTTKIESMRVNPKYIKEAINEHNRREWLMNEQNDNFSTIELNGGIYKVFDMSLEEFTKLNNAIDINDIRWT